MTKILYYKKTQDWPSLLPGILKGINGHKKKELGGIAPHDVSANNTGEIYNAMVRRIKAMPRKTPMYKLGDTVVINPLRDVSLTSPEGVSVVCLSVCR